MAELQPQTPHLPGGKAERGILSETDEYLLDFQKLQQMVLKVQPISHPWQWSPSASAIAAMKKLLRVLQALRSPDGGWDAAIPQTATTMAPYVAEEAADLLDAIEADLDAEPGLKPVFDQPFLLTSLVCQMRELIPRLLWAIARSQPVAMRLLEGMTAQVMAPGAEQPCEGILRLVVTLELALNGQTNVWDLVMGQPPDDLLAIVDGLKIQLPQINQAFEPAGVILRQLRLDAQQRLPELSQWFAGQRVELLSPDQGWQAGQMKLHIGLTFVPQSLENPGLVHLHSAYPTSLQALPAQLNIESAAPIAHLRFTDHSWVEQVRHAATQTAIMQGLSELTAVRTIAQANPPLSTEVAIAHLIEASLDWLTKASTMILLSDQFADCPLISLNHLADQLSWQLSQTAYPVVQLLGGIPCNVLQPDLSWRSGCLRLRSLLKFLTPENDWLLDLSHQQFVTTAEPAIFPTVVVYSEQFTWCQQPILLGELTDRLTALLQQHSSALLLLQQGTEVDLFCEAVDSSTEGGEAIPGMLQLELGFEFIS